MKKTAIDWLVEQVNSDCLNSAFIRPDLIKKAKQMERKQIMSAFREGNDNVILFDEKSYYKVNYKQINTK